METWWKHGGNMVDIWAGTQGLDLAPLRLSLTLNENHSLTRSGKMQGTICSHALKGSTENDHCYMYECDDHEAPKGLQ